MVRIIGGKYKGRSLLSIKSLKVRPTSDRVRESLFGILGDRMLNAEVLDLCAGIGAIGIEAFSRGAIKVFFVERDIQILNVIKKNLEKLEIKEDFQISHLNALSFVKRYSGRKLHFDFIYIDPPYNYSKNEELLSCISHGGLLKKEGILVIEHTRKIIMRDKFRYIEKVREKIISDTCLSFYEVKNSF